MLQQMTSKQVQEMIAYSTIEPVGPPIPPDPEEEAKKRAEHARAKFEGGMTALKQKIGDK